MLITSSISKYKKFFQKTLQNFKSLFSPSYQKLPKTPLYSVAEASVNNPSYKELEKFYSDFTQQWDSEKGNGRRRSKKKVVILSPPKQEKEVDLHSESNNALKKNEMEKREEYEDQKKKRGDNKDSSLVNCKSKRRNSNCLVEKKLREMEMLDKSDVDYVLDIEEVLHYYSRLTCPSYLEIVDKFFIEMCSEFFGGPERSATMPRLCSADISN